MTAMAHREECTAETLVLAFELGERTWVLGFGVGAGPVRVQQVPARDLAAVWRAIEGAKRKYQLPATAGVRSCYEAGRDGFWLHRALVAGGVRNEVIDSSSIEVARRARQAKTDRLDVRRLVGLVRRALGGERAYRVVRVPSVLEEDRRQLHRELRTAKRDRGRVTNRVGSLLVTHGVAQRFSVHASVATVTAQVGTCRQWTGEPLPPGVCARLVREWETVVALTARIAAIEREQARLLRTSSDPAVAMVRQLMQLRAIGRTSAWLWTMEAFAWRDFQNRRELGSFAGLTGTPWRSGTQVQEQGLSGGGHAEVRTLSIEIAWAWRRWQPHSALAQWYECRFGGGSARLRRIGIVALARKLLIALWRYVTTGVIPAGAQLKASRA
jgi:transposase